MISLVRKLVAGPKNRTTWKGEELDLTYISQRIIAMAYPGSGFEKTYRNSIDVISEYFKQMHLGNCLVINVSMRHYNYQLFDNLVNDYYWPDHQAPPLTTLFIICDDMFEYLRKNKNNVVAVHCNHGKGRTGTTIIAFMLLMRQFDNAQQALKHYNKKRFIIDTYGVDQPCQRRYLDYFQNLIKKQKIKKQLTAYRLVKITQEQQHLKTDRYFIQISQARSGKKKHHKLKINQNLKNNDIALIGDIFIQVFEIGWFGQNQMARVNYHLNFLQQKNNNLYIAQLNGKTIKINNNHPTNFIIYLHFEQFCNCHSGSINKKCSCMSQRQREQLEWDRMIDILEKCKKVSKKQMSIIIHGNTNKGDKLLQEDVNNNHNNNNNHKE